MTPIVSPRAALAFVVAIGGIFAWNVLSQQSEALASKSSIPLAPEFVGEPSQWLNVNGRKFSLKERRGKVTIVEFFTSGSSGDQSNLATCKTWATKWQSRGIEVVGVQEPEVGDSNQETQFARSSNLDFPILLDTSGANAKRWKQTAFPATCVVDEDGRTRFQWSGELNSNDARGEKLVEKQIEAILAETATPGKVVKSDTEWKRELAPPAYDVLRHAGTERPFTGALLNNHEKGIYRCAGCGQILFSSDAKFESGTGWPSFFQPIKRGAVKEKPDYSMLEERTEVLCPRCGGHLGHVFNDGPQPTGLRYCMNSVALTFDKTSK